MINNPLQHRLVFAYIQNLETLFGANDRSAWGTGQTPVKQVYRLLDFLIREDMSGVARANRNTLDETDVA